MVGTYALPVGIARHFVINGQPVSIPMVVEEPSIVAGASFMAKLAQPNGGFTATTTAPEMIGQIQILDIDDPAEARKKLLAEKDACWHRSQKWTRCSNDWVAAPETWNFD